MARHMLSRRRFVKWIASVDPGIFVAGLLVAGILSAACAGPDPTPSPVPSPVLTPPSMKSPTPSAALGHTNPSMTPLAVTPTFPPTSVPGGTSGPAPTPAAGPLRALAVERAFPNLTLRHLTSLAQADDGSARLFVTEQRGRVLVFADRQQVTQTEVFLDITRRVNEGQNEEGLLGLAFGPRFKETGYFYVYYSAFKPRRSVVSRFSVSRDDPAVADAESELIVMEIPQPYGNHNGGQLAFGPDGYLYIGLGDGGLRGDPHGNGQDPGSLLGSILRIDVAGITERERYRVPPDNPFVGVDAARQEVWAFGLRNPWRFSFDPQTGSLWAGDVGQNRWEEIDLVEKGLNYGWNVMEGAHCFSSRAGCDGTGLQLPVAEYSSADGCSVIGGYVYRGTALPSLAGAYVYGDFCSGSIWGLRYDGRAVTERRALVETGLQIASFGRDLAGNLYVLSRDSGIYRLVPGPRATP